MGLEEGSSYGSKYVRVIGPKFLNQVSTQGFEASGLALKGWGSGVQALYMVQDLGFGA